MTLARLLASKFMLFAAILLALPEIAPLAHFSGEKYELGHCSPNLIEAE